MATPKYFVVENPDGGADVPEVRFLRNEYCRDQISREIEMRQNSNRDKLDEIVNLGRAIGEGMPDAHPVAARAGIEHRDEEKVPGGVLVEVPIQEQHQDNLYKLNVGDLIKDIPF